MITPARQTAPITRRIQNTSELTRIMFTSFLGCLVRIVCGKGHLCKRLLTGVTGIELAAGGVDLDTKVLTECIFDTKFFKSVLKNFDLGRLGTFKNNLGGARVVADQIDMVKISRVFLEFDQVGEGLGMFDRVVDIFKKGVSNKTAVFGGRNVFIQGGKNVPDRVSLVYRHDLRSLLVERRVTGAGQINLRIFFDQSLDAWNEADGRDGEAMRRKGIIIR